MNFFREFLKHYYPKPNIIRVRDKFDKNPDKDLAFPTEFAKIRAEGSNNEDTENGERND